MLPGILSESSQALDIILVVTHGAERHLLSQSGEFDVKATIDSDRYQKGLMLKFSESILHLDAKDFGIELLFFAEP